MQIPIVILFNVFMALLGFPLTIVETPESHDFDFHDYFYHALPADSLKDERRFVIVNMGSIVTVNHRDSLRIKLTALLTKLEEYKPKAIGMDVFFPDSLDVTIDAALQSRIRKSNVVLAITASDSTIFGKPIKDYNNLGIINLPGAFKGSRRMYFRDVTMKGKKIPSFAIRLYGKIEHELKIPGDSIFYPHYTCSDNGYRDISESTVRNSNFVAVEADDLLKYKLSEFDSLRGKIILIGMLGMGRMSNETDISDKHKVPFDSDMEQHSESVAGVTIQADTLRSLIDRTWFESVNLRHWEYLIIILLIVIFDRLHSASDI